MFTLMFWKAAAERAVKTAAQTCAALPRRQRHRAAGHRLAAGRVRRWHGRCPVAAHLRGVRPGSATPARRSPRRALPE